MTDDLGFDIEQPQQRKYGLLVEVFDTETEGKSAIKIVDYGPESMPLNEVSTVLTMAANLAALRDQQAKLQALRAKEGES